MDYIAQMQDQGNEGDEGSVEIDQRGDIIEQPSSLRSGAKSNAEPRQQRKPSLRNRTTTSVRGAMLEVYYMNWACLSCQNFLNMLDQDSSLLTLLAFLAKIFQYVP